MIHATRHFGHPVLNIVFPELETFGVIYHRVCRWNKVSKIGDLSCDQQFSVFNFKFKLKFGLLFFDKVLSGIL